MNLPHATSFFLPHWWVEVFDRATVLNAAGGDPDAYVSTVKFLPYLKPLQLKLCSQIISIMQHQLLDGARDNIIISLPRVYNELQLLTRRQRTQAQLLLHELRSFRILQERKSGKESCEAESGKDSCEHSEQAEGKVQAWSLFADEAWHSSDDGVSVELQLATWGRELLLGYCEPYADFVRRAQRGLQLRALCDSAPLHLWKSVWLDVQGAEQLLYLRLEAAAQQQGNWLNLEHTLCQSLTDCSAGLQCSEVELLRLLTALGKKLTEHGCLLPHPVSQAVFLDAKQRQQPQLLWTLARFPTVQQNCKAWLQAVCVDLCTRRLAQTLEQLLALLVPDRRQRHQKLLNSFTALLSRLDAQEDVAVLTMFTAGCPLLDIALFFEWSLRRMLSVLPLPSALVPSVVGNALDADNAVPLHTRFANFRNWIKENPHFVQELSSAPQACLVSSAAADVPYAEVVSPQSSQPSATKVAPTREALALLRSQESLPLSRSMPEATEGEHLRKIAALELRKIVSRSRADYNQLERSYFASLSPEARQSILEVKKHMQAGIFENHLRPRLISFMIANPLSWQRTEAVKELRVFD